MKKSCLSFAVFAIFVGFIFTITLSCKKSDGSAPSEMVYTDLKINPEGLIVPKSMTFKISVQGLPLVGGNWVDVTSQATCLLDNPIASVDKAGNLSNTYTGTAVQRVNMTCSYGSVSKTVAITIVPAVLVSLQMTKNNLQMGSHQTQSIKVYGNFKDTNNWIFALDMTDFITWSSSNASVASASAGNVSSVDLGTANLTAAFGSITASTPVTVSNSVSSPTADPKGVGLLGQYYDFGIASPSSVPWTNSTIADPFERFFGQRIDSQVYFDWSTGVNNLGQPLYFGIRWTGKIYIPTTGSYTFYTDTDDGVRLWINDINGTPVINNWTLHASTQNTSAALPLIGGQFYDVKMEYFENAGYSLAKLSWSGPPSVSKVLIPQVYLFPE